MKRILFICSQNRLRSPTAEQVFANDPNVEAASAGLAPDAEEPLTPDHLEDAELIFVMERSHQRRLTARFARHLKGKKIVCLDIPDDFDFMDAELVALIEARVTPHLKRGAAKGERT